MSAPGIVTILTLLVVISLQELLLFAAPGIENAVYSSQDLLADESAPAMSLEVEKSAPLTRQRRHDEYESGGRSLFGRRRGRWRHSREHGHGFGGSQEHGHGFGHGFGQGGRHGFGQGGGHGFGQGGGHGFEHGHGHGRGHGRWRGRDRPDSGNPVGPPHSGCFFGQSPDSTSGGGSESSQSSEEEQTPDVPKNNSNSSPAKATTTTSAPSTTTTTTTTKIPTISSTTEDPTLNIDIRIGPD
ncbi:hypothetical protein ACLKA7_009635 [Drosophila subpalustris]